MRRTNKSHKVPNVKLRPAQASEHPTRARDTTWSHNSSDLEVAPSASMVDVCPRPFRGVTLCATGQVDKPTLFKQAFELGALSTSDFTDKVTHLIANTHGGAKYMCAVERKIPIMVPEWITQAYATWLRGDDVDVQESVSKYHLPVFSGVILSLSGIDDVNLCAKITRLLTAQQGVYVKNLERPVKVTHLLCSGDVETDKVRYAEKFNKRGEANIHLVWEEWFWDCLEFGGRFDERKYYVKRPRPERRSLPEGSVPDLQRNANCSAAPTTQPRSQCPPSEPSFVVIDNLNAELDEEEAAAIKRAPAVTLQLWQCLLRSRGFELDGGRLVRSPSKIQAMDASSSTTTRLPPLAHNGKGKEKESVISTFRRTNSFAPVPEKPTLRQPFKRALSFAAQDTGDAEGSGSKHCVVREVNPATFPLFVGYTFRLLGEARCANVRLAIERGGGVITDDVPEVDFIIVRLISGSKFYRDEPDELERSKYRTECWLEHSVFLERICAPQENVSFTPLGISTPLPDAEKIVLSLSGLDESELCWIRRLLRALGITLAQTFSRRSTHLLCPSARGAKFDKALEWRIPVVSMGWLDRMARQGSVPDASQCLVNSIQEGVIGLDPRRGVSTPAVNNDKGKGKEKDSDNRIPVIDSRTDFAPAPPSAYGQRLFAKKTSLLQDTVSVERPVHSPDTMDYSADEQPTWFFGVTELLHRPYQSSSSLPSVLPPEAYQDPAEAIRTLLPRPMSRSPSPFNNIDAQIPSSKSPSPLKALSQSTTELPPCARQPDLGQVTKALEKTLTVLLGKRQSSDEDILPHARKEKRPRPQPPSKTKPRGDLHGDSSSLSRPLPQPEFDSSCYEDISLLEREGAWMTDESMRVTYEDPVQLEEKRRLMALHGMGPKEDVGSGGRRTRKGTRVAGL